MTHVSMCIFQGLFKTIVFRSVTLVTKNLWAILDFVHRPDFFHSVPYPINQRKIFFNKKFFKLLLIKSHKILR